MVGARVIKTGVRAGALCTIWCTMHHTFTTFDHMTDTAQKLIRLTISVTPEVHAAFTRLSAASGQSMSSCMGEWLGDTLDAVEYTATLMEKARMAPKMVMREVHAYALGLVDETGAVLNAMRSGQPITDIPSTAAKVRAARAAAASDEPKGGGGRRRAGSPPPCNTGGKVPPSPERDDGSHAAAPRAKRATRSKQ